MHRSSAPSRVEVRAVLQLSGMASPRMGLLQQQLQQQLLLLLAVSLAQADVTLKIENMNSPHDIAAVKEALTGVYGAASADVKLGSATVVQEPGRKPNEPDPKALVEAVEAIRSSKRRFTATVLEPTGPVPPPQEPVENLNDRAQDRRAPKQGQPPAPDQVATSFAGSKVVPLTDQSFRSTVGGGDDLWLIYFYVGDLCPLCYQRSRTLMSVADRLDGTPIRVGAVDLDQHGSGDKLGARLGLTATDLKQLGRAEMADSTDRSQYPGPAPALKYVDIPGKISARRGLYQAQALPAEVPMKEDKIVEWLEKEVLKGRTTDQLAEELSGSGQPLLASLASVDWAAALQKMQDPKTTLLSQIDENGQPSALLIGGGCFVSYMLLSCLLSLSLSRKRARSSTEAATRKQERDAFEQKERARMAVERDANQKDRAAAQAQRAQEAAEAKAAKKDAVVKRKDAATEAREVAIARMDMGSEERKAVMQEKLAKMSKSNNE